MKMKLQIRRFIAVAIVSFAAFSVSCSIDEANFTEPQDYVDGNNQQSGSTEGQVGTFSLSNIMVVVDTDNEVVSKTRAIDDTIDTDGYYVIITSDDADSDMEPIKMTYAEIKENGYSIELTPGNYAISAQSYEDGIPALSWDSPEYQSISYNFIISDGTTTQLEDDVVCTLANIKVSVDISDALLAKFDSETLVVKVTMGDVEVIYGVNEDGELINENGDVAYFAPQDDNTTMVVSIVGDYNIAAEGEEADYVSVNWTQSITNVTAGQSREIAADLTSSVETGSASFEVTISSSVAEEKFEVDIMDGDFYTPGEDEIEDESTPDVNEEDLTCKIEWVGGYSFDETYEIFYTDDLSELTPMVFNLTSESGITKLSVQINSDVLSASELGKLNLAQTMDLINPTSDEMEEALIGLGFPVGDDVKGKTELVLDITSFMTALVMISESGDTTDFVITVGDASGNFVRTLKVVVVK